MTFCGGEFYANMVDFIEVESMRNVVSAPPHTKSQSKYVDEIPIEKEK